LQSQYIAGTPPRLDGRTINYSSLLEQYGDNPPSPFSFLNATVRQVPHPLSSPLPLICSHVVNVYAQVPNADKQVLCHMTYTNEETHRIIRENLDKSPNFESGDGKLGLGPR
jgi:tRNA uridine 5-carboxymethylaminomethyl modification enzyme